MEVILKLKQIPLPLWKLKGVKEKERERERERESESIVTYAMQLCEHYCQQQTVFEYISKHQKTIHEFIKF